MSNKFILVMLADCHKKVIVSVSKILDIQETEYGCFLTLGFTHRGKSIGCAVIDSMKSIIEQLEG